MFALFALALALFSGQHSPVSPCLTEDQYSDATETYHQGDAVESCYWNAATRGNGIGQSFIALSNGTVINVGPYVHGK